MDRSTALEALRSWWARGAQRKGKHKVVRDEAAEVDKKDHAGPQGRGEDSVLCPNSEEKPLVEQSREGNVSILAFLKCHSRHSGKDRLGGSG